MPKYIVEVSTRSYYEYEIEAEDEAQAEEYAIDRANEDIRDEWFDWDIDYVGEVEDGEVES